MTSVFVNGWAGAGNRGDELLISCLVARLRALGVDEIVIPSLDPDHTASTHGVTAISHRSLVAAVRHIQRADLFVMGPGGIVQDDTSIWSLPYQTHRALLARLVGTPAIGMGLGVEPLRRRTSPWLLRRTLARVEPLIVRDQPSAQRALAAGLPTAEATADLALGSAIPDAGDEDLLVVALRPHRPGGGGVPVRFQDEAADAETISGLASALDAASRTTQLRVHFVAFEPDRDQPLHEAVAAQMTEPTSHAAPNHDRLVAEVARGRAVVATRFHAGIAALLSARPAVLLGYAAKVTALAQAVGPGFAVVPNDREGHQAIAAELERVLSADPGSLADARDRMVAIEAGNVDLLEQALRGG